MKKRLLSLLQIVIGVGLFAFIFCKIENKQDLVAAIGAAARHWRLLIGGVVAFFFCLVLVTVRWQLLLASQGLVLPFGRAIQLYFIGHFWNSFLFGVTGGDVVKAYYAAAETQHKKAEAVSTVFIDRIVGLLALVVLCMVVMVCRLRFFLSSTETRLALAFNTAVFIGAVVGLTVVFMKDVFLRWPLFKRLEEKTGFGAIVRRVYDAFHICLSQRGLLLRTIALSLGNHLVLVGCAAMLGAALEIELGFIDYLSMFPVINAICAIPISPGGMGTREAATVYLLGVVGVSRASAFSLSLLLYGTLLFWSAVGGVVYVLYSRSRGKPVMDADGFGAE